MEGAGGPLRATHIGFDPSFDQDLSALFDGVEISPQPCDLNVLSEPLGTEPHFIICGVPPADMNAAEVGQTLRMQFPDLPILMVVHDDSKIDRKNILKNGFTDIFFLPMDREFLKTKLNELFARIRGGSQIFKSVKLLDLAPGAKMDFDTYVYLPMNNKHVKYSSSGMAMADERVRKLKEHQMHSLFVLQEDMPKFYAHAAKALKSKDGGACETERAEKLRDMVRELVSQFFTDAATGLDGGKKVIEECQRIIHSFVSSERSWYDRVMAVAEGGEDSYSRTARVSTYAALFGAGLNLPTLDDLIQAGLLHDIGLARVPYEIHQKPAAEWSEEERKTYQRHPEFSIEMIRERKLVVSELVHKIILQHHERFGGTGYPKGLTSTKLCLEAQVLFVAEYFDNCMAPAPGRALPAPVEVLNNLRMEGQTDPGRATVDPALLKKLIALFPGDSSV